MSRLTKEREEYIRDSHSNIDGWPIFVAELLAEIDALREEIESPCAEGCIMDNVYKRERDKYKAALEEIQDECNDTGSWKDSVYQVRRVVKEALKGTE
jgi:hypothetical protein